MLRKLAKRVARTELVSPFPMRFVYKCARAFGNSTLQGGRTSAML